jgi:hypothetical protein
LKALDVNSRATYSNISLVDFSKISASLRIWPHLVTAGVFMVRFSNKKEGKVTAKLFSNIGQLVINQPIGCTGSTDKQLINLPQALLRATIN